MDAGSVEHNLYGFEPHPHTIQFVFNSPFQGLAVTFKFYCRFLWRKKENIKHVLYFEKTSSIGPVACTRLSSHTIPLPQPKWDTPWRPYLSEIKAKQIVSVFGACMDKTHSNIKTQVFKICQTKIQIRYCSLGSGSAFCNTSWQCRQFVGLSASQTSSSHNIQGGGGFPWCKSQIYSQHLAMLSWQSWLCW